MDPQTSDAATVQQESATQPVPAAKPTPMPQEVRAYLEDLLQSAGIHTTDPVAYEAMIQDLFLKLDEFLSLKIIDYLPDDKLEEFTQLAESHTDPQAMQDYITKNVPNAQDIFIVAFGEFKDMYLNSLNPQQQPPVLADETQAEQSQPVAQ